MEDNPNLMCEILVCMLKFLDRKIEAEFLYIDMETGNIRYGQLREAIGDWEYILVLYESAITRLPKKSITSGLTLAKLYFSAVDSVLKSYLFEKEVKLELKKEGYNKLKECMMQADEIYNKYWWLQSRLKLIYLKILDAIINGYICSEIEQEMEEIHRDMANKMWSWENTLLYNKTEAIYTLYSSRKKPNIKEIKESILRIVNMANDQIDALTREDNKQIDEVVKKTSEALEKEFIEQCQKIYHIAD